MTPQILTDIVTFLKEHLSKNTLLAEVAENGDGRTTSIIDEQHIIEILKQSKFQQYIQEPNARQPGDILVHDPVLGMVHVVNIKSTTCKAPDNATSKLGFLYAFTDISLNELPSSILDKKFAQLMESRKKDIPGKDYWYLVFDKNDMSRVLLRGSKQIVKWKYNPSNLLQIHWGDEWKVPEAGHTFDEAFDAVYGGIKKCIKKKVASYPTDWIV